MGNAFPRAFIPTKIDQTTRRRLWGGEYPADWVGTSIRLFGGHNYGYLLPFGPNGDNALSTGTREHVEWKCQNMTEFGLVLVAFQLVGLYQLIGNSIFPLLAIAFAHEEFLATKKNDPITGFRTMSGSSGLVGILAGYSVHKLGAQLWPRADKTFISYITGNFVLLQYLYMLYKDWTKKEHVKHSGIAHDVHFEGLAVGWLLSAFVI